MEVGHLVRFSSQQHPFLIQTTPCLDLDCSCSVMGLTLTEVEPSGATPRERLTFTLRVCLRTWIEHDPPPRSLEVESLVHEFLARFPSERIQELGEEFQRARAVKKRLQTLSLTGSPDELVSYSSVIQEGGGIEDGLTDQSCFFVFEGRDFLIEDHYCANPDCDCRQVHVEFWERVHRLVPQRGIQIRQQLMATFGLEGKLKEIRFSEESSSTTKYLLQSWRRRCGDQLAEFRRRYELLKTIGARSFAVTPKVTARVDAKLKSPSKQRAPQLDAPQQVGRNAPCPCGSGLKFKRCCARRTAVGE